MNTQPLRDIIGGIIKTWDRDPKFNQDQIIKIWKNAAGMKLARHSRPASFKSHRLIVNVDSSGYLYELTLRRPEILGKLKKEFEGKDLRELQFRIGEINHDKKE